MVQYLLVGGVVGKNSSAVSGSGAQPLLGADPDGVVSKGDRRVDRLPLGTEVAEIKITGDEHLSREEAFFLLVVEEGSDPG